MWVLGWTYGWLRWLECILATVYRWPLNNLLFITNWLLLISFYVQGFWRAPYTRHSFTAVLRVNHCAVDFPGTKSVTVSKAVKPCSISIHPENKGSSKPIHVYIICFPFFQLIWFKQIFKVWIKSETHTVLVQFSINHSREA